MTDAGSTISDTFPSKRMADGLGAPFGARLADRVSIEADRASGTIVGAAAAAKAASQTYGELVTEGYARAIRSSMRSGAEIGDHLAALMRARTPLEVFELNSAFLREQISTLPSRALETMGLGLDAAPGWRP